MYDMDYGTSSSGLAAAGIWGIIALVIAICATIVIFVLFLTKKNEKKYKGFLGWLYDFLTFKKCVIDYILRFTYVCLAIYLTLASFGLIGTSFLLFLTTLIGGNLVLRIAYEFSLMLINICVNVAEINKKMK
ncbi:MAG: hypothetical protein MR265_06020 [Erysipelotrichaceae bacterium]|nr:hypothetical protein [Erysipelotrichaceae bacterium]